MSASVATSDKDAPAARTSGEGKALIKARGLTKVYEQGKVEVHALRGVDLDICDGEFTALVGPSGSGKSTLLNIVGALDEPTSGEVTLAGVDMTRLVEKKTGMLFGRKTPRLTAKSRKNRALFRLERIGFVFQAYNLLPVLTAFENAEYTLMLRGVPPEERRKRVIPLLERVGLGREINRRPHELSGGQQQRVAVVRAIAPEPSIVLADEPTANLDSETSHELIDLMLELNQDSGITFLFASHDLTVMQRCRRIVHLKDGLVERDEQVG